MGYFGVYDDIKTPTKTIERFYSCVRRVVAADDVEAATQAVTDFLNAEGMKHRKDYEFRDIGGGKERAQIRQLFNARCLLEKLADKHDDTELREALETMDEELEDYRAWVAMIERSSYLKALPILWNKLKKKAAWWNWR